MQNLQKSKIASNPGEGGVRRVMWLIHLCTVVSDNRIQGQSVDKCK